MSIVLETIGIKQEQLAMYKKMLENISNGAQEINKGRNGSEFSAKFASLADVNRSIKRLENEIANLENY